MLDPKPWQLSYAETESEHRYTFKQGNRSAARAMQWRPRKQYSQDMEDYR